MKYVNRKKGGFTLVELVLVIIIIGILAALAIPQFTSSTDDAREATIKSNLAVLRNAISLYYTEHNSTYPPAATFAAAMTQYSDKSGATSATKDATHTYGPYMVSVPDNPAVDATPNGVNDVAMANHGTVTTSGGWNYDEDTGVIHANSTGHTAL